MYLYQMTLYKDTSRVIGAPGDNTVNTTDFVANDKPLAVKVDEVVLSETTFVIDKTYAQFEALLVSPVTWADVKYTENENSYVCYLMTE